MSLAPLVLDEEEEEQQNLPRSERKRPPTLSLGLDLGGQEGSPQSSASSTPSPGGPNLGSPKFLSADEYKQAADTVARYPRLCSSAEERRGAQFVTHLACPSPDTVFKDTTEGKFAALQNHAQSNAADILRIFEQECQRHEEVNRLIGGWQPSEIRNWNLVRTPACWYEPYPYPNFRAQDTRLNLIQDYVHSSEQSGGTLLAFLLHRRETGELGELDVQMAVLAVIAQVLGTVFALFRAGLLHNDVHAENVLLTQWATPNALYPQYLGYQIGSQQFTVDCKESPYLAKLIDYGLMTRGVPLDTTYRVDLTLRYPWTDVCQFLAGFDRFVADLPFLDGLPDRPGLNSVVCGPAGSLGREGVNVNVTARSSDVTSNEALATNLGKVIADWLTFYRAQLSSS